MPDLKFVYLASAPFSGSTLFSFAAGTHPQLATVGEMTGLLDSSDAEVYRCSCGDLIRDCAFWREISGQMSQRNLEFDPTQFDTRFRFGDGAFMQRIASASFRMQWLELIRDKLLFALPANRRRRDYLLARTAGLAQSVLGATGKTVFLDASKTARTIRYLMSDELLDLRVIHLVRDVRGVSMSRRRNKGERNVAVSARKWVKTNSNIERQLARLPETRWMRVRYEDFCRYPHSVMNDFFRFCGLEPRAEFNVRWDNHIIGNRMRLRNSAAISLDESWRGKLTKHEQEQINAVAGPLHARYGYPPMRTEDLLSVAR